MAKALAASHFKPPPLQPLATLPGIGRLGQRLAEACTKGLGVLRPGPWRVTVEGVHDEVPPGSDADAMLLRFESGNGSLTCQLIVDRQAMSAILEATMGGTGAEAAFNMGERPLSRIESRILELARTSLAQELCMALGEQLERAFSLFQGSETPALEVRTSGLAQFRFVLNVFSYSGEIRLTFARAELERELSTASVGSEAEQAAAKRHQLQQEVGKSDVQLIVTLGPEMLPLAAISALEPGRFVALSATATAPVILWSGGVAAYEGVLARNGERLAVTITSAVA